MRKSLILIFAAMKTATVVSPKDQRPALARWIIAGPLLLVAALIAGAAFVPGEACSAGRQPAASSASLFFASAHGVASHAVYSVGNRL